MWYSSNVDPNFGGVFVNFCHYFDYDRGRKREKPNLDRKGDPYEKNHSDFNPYLLYDWSVGLYGNKAI